MKKIVAYSFIFASLIAATDASSDDQVQALYAQLAERSARIDTQDAQQRAELCDILSELKATVDACNENVQATLKKYEALQQKLNLTASYSLNISVDNE